MWLKIANLAHGANCKLTVYMDDVTISGDSIPESLMWQIRQQLHNRGLKYHKERHYQHGIAEITGVIVRDEKTVLPNRQRKKVHDLRKALRETGDLEEASAIQRRISGMKTQQKQVERSSRRQRFYFFNGELIAFCRNDRYIEFASSAAKLGRWLIAAAIAWAAHHAELTIAPMEVHMEASLSFDVHGEAHGVVGPVGVR